MKQKIYLLIILISIIHTSFGQNKNQTRQIILKLKNDIVYSDISVPQNKISGNIKIDAVTQKYKAEKMRMLSLGLKDPQYYYVVSFPEGINMNEVIDAYYSTHEICFAEPDYIVSLGSTKAIVPDDYYYHSQWGLKNDGTFSYTDATPGADIDMEGAWGIEQGDTNIIVAIIDTGCKLDHPEFRGRIWINKDEIPGNEIDDDNNGYIDEINGWDFANDDRFPVDDNGHGTNVTGIIGANGNNFIGYAGVDWKCKLMVLKCLSYDGWGYYSWIINGIYFAVDNGANVINISLGGTDSSTAFKEAVNYALKKNVTVVASMGNENTDEILYPAGYPGVIAVGSTDPDDKRSHPFFWSFTSGSNYGNHISVVAPGNYIFGLDYESSLNFNYYWGGTSQAAPHVSGLASLLLAQNPNRTNTQIKSIIEATAEDLVGSPAEDKRGWDKYYGYGRINALYALLFSDYSRLDDQNFFMFPNPTKQDFTIIVPEFTEQIQIFNSFGSCIQTEIIDKKSLFHFQIKAKGMYFVKVTTDKDTFVKKLIVCQ